MVTQLHFRRLSTNVRLFCPDACPNSCSDGWLRYPNPVPDGTRVPEWAFIDVTVSGAPCRGSSRTWELMYDDRKQ
jgi:hypothetical protein